MKKQMADSYAASPFLAGSMASENLRKRWGLQDE